jgi:hypothetical protein
MTFTKSYISRVLLAAAFCAVIAPSAHAEPYCQKGAPVEMRWTGEWQPRVVEGGPNEYGQCQLSGDGNPPQWISRDRIRPVGGGEFSDHVVPEAPVTDAGPAIIAPDMDAVVAAPEEDVQVDPATGKRLPPKLKHFGELLPGVYACKDMTLSFGIIDARTYRSYDSSDSGRYFYNQGTNILEMTSGGGRGRKYRRNTDRSFVVVGDNTQDCVYKPGKDPRGGNW